MNAILTKLYQGLLMVISALVCTIMLWLSNNTTAHADSRSTPDNAIKSLKFQNTESIEAQAKQFLLSLSPSNNGKTTVTIQPLDKFLKVEACPTMEAFLPSGNKAWGKTTVGIKCKQHATWTLFLQAQVNVYANVIVSAKPLSGGHTLTIDDLYLQEAELGAMPTGVITDPNEVVGKTLSRSLPAGTPLRIEMIKAPFVISQGQSIKVVSTGKGFSVSNDAQALNNAYEGQLVKAKTAGGIVVSGIAQASGQVLVAN